MKGKELAEHAVTVLNDAFLIDKEAIQAAFGPKGSLECSKRLEEESTVLTWLMREDGKPKRRINVLSLINGILWDSGYVVGAMYEHDDKDNERVLGFRVVTTDSCFQRPVKEKP